MAAEKAVRRFNARLATYPLFAPSPPRPAVLAQVWQCSAPLQICLDLGGVRAKGALDLLIEVRVAIVDVVHILVLAERTPPAERLALPAQPGRHAGAG